MWLRDRTAAVDGRRLLSTACRRTRVDAWSTAIPMRFKVSRRLWRACARAPAYDMLGSSTRMVLGCYDFTHVSCAYSIAPDDVRRVLCFTGSIFRTGLQEGSPWGTCLATHSSGSVPRCCGGTPMSAAGLRACSVSPADCYLPPTPRKVGQTTAETATAA